MKVVVDTNIFVSSFFWRKPKENNRPVEKWKNNPLPV